MCENLPYEKSKGCNRSNMTRKTVVFRLLDVKPSRQRSMHVVDMFLEKLKTTQGLLNN